MNLKERERETEYVCLCVLSAVSLVNHRKEIEAKEPRHA